MPAWLYLSILYFILLIFFRKKIVSKFLLCAIFVAIATAVILSIATDLLSKIDISILNYTPFVFFILGFLEELFRSKLFYCIIKKTKFDDVATFAFSGALVYSLAENSTWLICDFSGNGFNGNNINLRNTGADASKCDFILYSYILASAKFFFHYLYLYMSIICMIKQRFLPWLFILFVHGGFNFLFTIVFQYTLSKSEWVFIIMIFGKLLFLMLLARIFLGFWVGRSIYLMPRSGHRFLPSPEK